VRHQDEVERGRSIREEIPRRAHGHWVAGKRDPLAILLAQNSTRLPQLVGLRMQRMTASPFAFYRGTAAVMAADLATGPLTGIQVISCGDAHVSNFGFYASPQRTLVFDLNDFDESAAGPWDWDLKRLVTSAIIGARDIGFSDESALAAGAATARAYRRGLAELMELSALDRYYWGLDIDRIRESFDGQNRQVIDRIEKQARKRGSAHAVAKMSTVGDDGVRRFIDAPPVTARVPEADRGQIRDLFEQYRATVSPDIAVLLSQYELTDVALRAVGVGSVGTRCYVLLLTGPRGAYLMLQVKEAEASVLYTWGTVEAAAAENQGARVVASQRILQAVSDPFLGYLTAGERNFYVRQFRDMKGSVDVAALSYEQFESYVAGCARLLARAHAQSPEAPAILGYIGRSGAFDRAVVEWSRQYADQSLSDFTLVSEAVRDRAFA
jgi:uncharacterized protein (DUF2252 family)